jgi:hypothetical protein
VAANRWVTFSGPRAALEVKGQLVVLRGLFVPTLLLGIVLGCGSSGNVKTYPVKGKVTYAGKPMVGGGSIALLPLSNQEGKTAGGVIKEDGTYELETYSPGDGSMAGNFRVVITQITVKEPTATPDGSATPSSTIFTVPKADQIPMIYGDIQNSPLTAKVEAKSQNELDFDLKPQ